MNPNAISLTISCDGRSGISIIGEKSLVPEAHDLLLSSLSADEKDRYADLAMKGSREVFDLTVTADTSTRKLTIVHRNGEVGVNAETRCAALAALQETYQGFEK